MNLVFAGTPRFAVPALEALLAAGHTICAVYCQPDRPAGRGRKLVAGPVKSLALAHGIVVRQPTTLTGQVNDLAALAPDAMIVIAYGLLLPPAILAVPRHGCINVHASLLPRWRGAAPIARAIEAGDPTTGVCTMRMEAGLDTGPIFGCRSTAIGETETAATLHDGLAALGASLLLDTLVGLAEGVLRPQAQDAALACYARKLTKEEAVIDWQEPATHIHRKIRALNPWPVAQTRFRDRTLRLWEVSRMMPAEPSSEVPGTILRANASGIVIRAGDGPLGVTRLQLEGGKVVSAADFANGQRVVAGERFG